MAKIYRSSDRINLQIGDVAVKVAPLTFHQKSEIQLAIAESGKTGDTMGVLKAAFLCVKYAVKEINGVEAPDGSKYELQFENEVLSDESVNDLFNLEESDALSIVCINLMKGRYEDFVDPNTGERLEGVKILGGKSSGKKQKRTVGS